MNVYVCGGLDKDALSIDVGLVEEVEEGLDELFLHALCFFLSMCFFSAAGLSESP